MRRTVFATLFFASLAACGSDAVIISKDTPPDPLTVDECAELCNLAPDETQLGCDVLCFVDAGRDHHANADAVILSLGYDSNGAISCDLVVICPDPTECQRLYSTCLTDSADPDSCQAILDTCLCGENLDGCYASADTNLDLCNQSGADDCMLDWYLAYCVCDQSYDRCMNTEPAECSMPQAMIAPPPAQTGPWRWTLTRRLIDEQLTRLSQLQRQTLAWPSANAARSEWRGVRLGRVDSDNILHQIGLRTNDLVRMVNGQRVTEVLRSPPALQALRQASTIHLEIQRNGAIRTLRYDLIK